MRKNEFESYLKKIKETNRELENLLNKIAEKGDIYIIGGALRDSYFNNLIDYKIRDLDLVFSEKIDKIKEILEEYSYYKNRFGGYKLKLDELYIDIWSYYDSWAFKNKLVKSSKCSLSSLSKGTFLNIDSLVYNYNTSEMYSYFFKKIIEKRKIDFISKNEEYIEKNPNSSLNIVRMLYMQDKYSLTFSDKVKEYIIKYSNKDYKKLYNAQFQHYHQEILEENKIKEKIEILIGE